MCDALGDISRLDAENVQHLQGRGQRNDGERKTLRTLQAHKAYTAI